MSLADLQNRLKNFGIAPTRQRLEVAEVLLEKPQHLAADQILAILRRKDSSVSKATVYNTLHLFGEKGLIRELHIDSGRTFYDSTTHPHHHFYHVQSGELSDIPASQVHLVNLPPLPEGTRQDSIEVLIKIRDEKK